MLQLYAAVVKVLKKITWCSVLLHLQRSDKNYLRFYLYLYHNYVYAQFFFTDNSLKICFINNGSKESLYACNLKIRRFSYHCCDLVCEKKKRYS